MKESSEPAEQFQLDYTKERLRQKALGLFIDIRGKSEIIPPFDLLPWHEGYQNYKCRKINFLGTAGWIWMLIRYGIITDPALIEESNHFLAYVKQGNSLDGTNPLGDTYKTKADIDYLNSMLDKYIRELLTPVK